MSCAREARKLADYITCLPNLNLDFTFANKISYYHIGALFTDVVLQAGLNYNSVVKPRVQKVLLNYPEEYTITRFRRLIDTQGLNNIISWNHPIKIERFERILQFSQVNNIDSCSDLQAYFYHNESHEQFLALNGFGPKSLDYLLRLLNIDSVAVDRHIYSFVKLADINVTGYRDTKRVVEFAADFLSIPRSAVDQIIWNYMSKKQYLASRPSGQASLNFPNL